MECPSYPDAELVFDARARALRRLTAARARRTSRRRWTRCVSWTSPWRTTAFPHAAARPTNPSPPPYFVPGLTHTSILIELRQALISYQDYHILVFSSS